MVTARNSSHFGASAWWAQKLAAAGLIGIVMCNATPLVAAWQGRDKILGTNPICMAVPGPNTFLLDMATTTVALNRIHKADSEWRQRDSRRLGDGRRRQSDDRSEDRIGGFADAAWRIQRHGPRADGRGFVRGAFRRRDDDRRRRIAREESSDARRAIFFWRSMRRAFLPMDEFQARMQ